MRDPEFRQAIVSGYRRYEVDVFVARVLAALRDPSAPGSISEQEIIDEEFPQAWGGAGYRKDDVDQWLDEAEQTLHQARR